MRKFKNVMEKISYFRDITTMYMLQKKCHHGKYHLTIKNDKMYCMLCKKEMEE